MFLNGISSITAGNTASAEARLFVKTSSYSMPSVIWRMLDSTGALYNSGEASSVQATPSATIPGQTDIVITAEISVPSNINVDKPTGFQLLWIATFADDSEVRAFEHFTVNPRLVDNQGPDHVVSLYGEPAELHLVLPTEFPNLRCDLYKDNTLMESVTPVKTALDGGARYTATFVGDYQEAGGASLVPFSAIWRYGDSPSVPNMEYGSLYLVNPTILGAESEIRQFLLKAYQDAAIEPGTEFQAHNILLHLRQGCELFNAAGYPTAFTMVRASGAVRSLWLRYSMIAACRSQYMTEGMKAFSYGGQVVTLDSDRSQYWDTMAGNLQAEVDQLIKPFKENLVRRGLTGGDGDINGLGLMKGAVGAIGITLTPISPVRGSGSLYSRTR